MADRLTDIVLGLQRMADGARMRAEDLEYSQREERYELVHYLDQLLTMVDKLRGSLLEDRKRLMPASDRPAQLPQTPQQTPQTPQIPRVVTKGPREAAG